MYLIRREEEHSRHHALCTQPILRREKPPESLVTLDDSSDSTEEHRGKALEVECQQVKRTTWKIGLESPKHGNIYILMLAVIILTKELEAICRRFAKSSHLPVSLAQGKGALKHPDGRDCPCPFQGLDSTNIKAVSKA